MRAVHAVCSDRTRNKYQIQKIPFHFTQFQIDLKHINQKKEDDNKVELGIDLREFYPSVEWDILGVPSERHEKYYPCCAEPYPGKRCAKM